MALTLDDPEIERLARELAFVRHAGVAESVALALREQLVREHTRQGMKPLSEILAGIRERMSGVPRYHADKTADELLGYNEFGLFD